MDKEEALAKVKAGTKVVYEGATNNICVGVVRHISEYGTVGVDDIDTGSNTDTLRGGYTRTAEEYFLLDAADDDWYLKAQTEKHGRTPSQQEVFWYKLCRQNSKLRDEYAEQQERVSRALGGKDCHLSPVGKLKAIWRILTA